ncbi:DNA mismatch repair endonuclease MutL [bacterium]|nr:MAG: DNA mismatch repair endonuclease MutL [bacterium]
MPIRQLDPHTVNQIAAGEVVERPSSVVKELVENALDAGAKRIEVELRDSGRTLIRVSDDGSGMNPDDARLALSRHATSKIGSVEDLQDVRTLGFRGEALPSIASVSRFTLKTGDQDGLRTVLRVNGGELLPASAEGGPQGTEVRAEDLFFNVPARLKFLKSDGTELGQSLDVVSRLAIARPDVAFKFIHNGQVGLETEGRGDRLEALAGVWGREIARTLVEIDSQVGDMRVTGFVSPPHVTKPTRAFQYSYVNGRAVRSRSLTTAIDLAFRDITPERRHPLLALLIEAPPETVDVNVSPTKSEVRFQKEGAAFDAIRVGLKQALLAHGMMPDALGLAKANEALAGSGALASSGGAWVAERGSFVAPLQDFRLEAQTPDQPFLPQSDLRSTIFDEPGNPEVPSLTPNHQPFASILDGLRVIGQVMKTFIIAETDHGVVIVDQHVAHERILYEYLCGIRGQAAVERQRLLVPQTLHLDKRSALLLRERLDELEQTGFELEPFGGESYVVRTVPAALRGKDPIRFLKDLADELVDTAIARKLTPTREQIWIMASCKMAVKAGDPLSHPEMEKLLIDLAQTENPYLCPHGRPITATLSTEGMLRLFKRI